MRRAGGDRQAAAVVRWGRRGRVGRVVVVTASSFAVVFRLITMQNRQCQSTFRASVSKG